MLSQNKDVSFFSLFSSEIREINSNSRDWLKIPPMEIETHEDHDNELFDSYVEDFRHTIADMKSKLVQFEQEKDKMAFLQKMRSSYKNLDRFVRLSPLIIV
jgi:hypothetical protein